ncbi:MAG: radical protein [Firmicutes bacterium]|nr:radical protein [Bacillota bacterium]
MTFCALNAVKGVNIIMEKSPEQLKIEQMRREKLIREKPYVMEKIFKYKEKEARGECVPLVEIIYDHKCNMNCTHCSNACYEKKDRALTPNDVANIARQADELGLAQFSISGGEPLLFDDLDEVVAAIDPKRFHISISTNGFFLDLAKAKHLKSIGVDKVKISVDSIDEKIYAETRLQTESYSKAFQALFNAQEAGLQAVVQTVITHQNCKTKETEKLAQFCQENGFNMDILVARAIGRWEGKEDVLVDESDAEHLVKLHEKYPVVHRDVFPTYNDCQGSCGTVKRLLFVTKYGDVLPCGFIHIGIGNIFEESLKDIIERGIHIKHFAQKNPKCLSGEDRHFIRNYMSKFYGKPLPVDYREVFTKEDFIKEE